MELIKRFDYDVNGPVKVQYLDGNFFSQDAYGNIFYIYLHDGENPVTLTGTVSADVVRPDGGTIACSDGGISGNIVFIRFPPAVYAIPGTISIVVKVTDSPIITTVAAVVANVYQSSTDTVVDPGNIIPSIENLIAAIDAAVASIPADYSDLWASLAPNYSNITFPVYTGNLCTYQEHIYRAKCDILTSETWNSAHWAQTDLGNNLADLRGVVNRLMIVPGENILDGNDFDTATDSNVTYSFSDGVITVTNGSTETYAGVYTSDELLAKLENGKSYRFHAYASATSGNPAVVIATKTSSNYTNPMYISVNGQGYVDFTMSSDITGIAILVAWGASTQGSVVEFSDIWVKELDVDVYAREECAKIKNTVSFNDERTMGFLSEQIGIREYLEWKDGAFLTSGTTIDPSSPIIPTSNTWKCLSIPCAEGDTFYVNIQNATSSYRPWAWVSSNNEKLSSASANAVNANIVAPTGAAYLVCNARVSSTNVYYVRKGNNPIPNDERFLSSIVCDAYYAPDCIKGQVIDSDDGTNKNNSKYIRTELVTGVPAINAIKLNNASYIMKASFYDNTGTTGGTGYLWSTEYIGNVIYLPAVAEKVAISVRRTDYADVSDSDLATVKAALSAQSITDISLTKRGIPADAQSVGNSHREDVKGVYSELGLTWYPFTRGGAIKTNVATIDVESIDNAPGWYYCVVSCSPGDVFHISVWDATTSYRPWAFVASDGTRISVASANRVDTNITAPTDAAYLVANAKSIEKLKLTSGTINFPTVSDLNERFYSRELLGIFMTIGVVGDSLASGQGRINDLNHFHDFYEYSWPQQMKRRLGNEVYNFTESSMTTRSWLTDADHGWPLASDGNHKCQAYIIGLGANDISIIEDNPSYLGSESDVHVDDYTQNPDTYYGNYARIISMLRTLEPRSIIFVLTNPSYGSSSIRAQCNVAVEYMATAFDGVYCVPIDASLFNSGYISANKVKSHYTPGAYLYIANYLMQAMSKIIYDHPQDFYFVNLIGTNYETPVIS